MKTLFPARLAVAAFSLAAAVFTTVSSSAQEQGSQDPAFRRRVIDSAPPAYPALARSMALSGVVKADVLVAPDGSVKAVDVRGGHPVLAQAAAKAVRQWRWEAAAHETHELVQLRFAPPE
jgi:TonB family protein